MKLRRYSVISSTVMNDGDSKVIPANASRVRVHVSAALTDPAGQLYLALYVDSNDRSENIIQSVNNFGAGAIDFDYRNYGDLVQRRLVVAVEVDDVENVPVAIVETISIPSE